MGVTRWIGYTVGRIPVLKITEEKQHPFGLLLDRILEAKTPTRMRTPASWRSK